jgi:hypothetical protein
MAVSHATGRGGLAGVGARIVPWRQLAIGIANVSDRLTAPPARARPAPCAVHPAAAHQGGLLAGLAPGRHVGGGTQGAGCSSADVAHDAESTDVGLGLFCRADVAGRAGMVQVRHRRFHLPPPIMSEANQFSSWSKMLGSIQGRPVALKLPIQKATVRWLLAWRPDTLAARVAAGHAGCTPRRLWPPWPACGSTRLRGCRCATCGSTISHRTGCPASRGRARCTSTGGRTTRSARATTPRSGARGIRSWTWWRSFAAGWSSLGSRCIRRTRSRRGRRRHASSAAVPAHALCQGRGHCGHTAAVHATAGERLDPLGGQASRRRLLALLGHLGAQRGDLDSDQGAL